MKLGKEHLNMKLYLKQKVFSWTDQFTVYDREGRDYCYVKGELFSWGTKLHILDLSGNEIAFIEQKLMSFFPKYRIYRNGREVAEVVQEFTFFRPRYSVNGPEWDVRGDFLGHDYEIMGGGRTIASVSKEWFTWGDAYEINIADGLDEVLALSVVLVIDACIAASND